MCCVVQQLCCCCCCCFFSPLKNWQSGSLQLPVCFLFRRRSPSRAGEAVHPEAASVLRPLRLRLGPPEWPKMEGGEASRSERDGGIHHPQQECHHRAHLPRSSSYGQCQSSHKLLQVLCSNIWRKFPQIDTNVYVKCTVYLWSRIKKIFPNLTHRSFYSEPDSCLSVSFTLITSEFVFSWLVVWCYL